MMIVTTLSTDSIITQIMLLNIYWDSLKYIPKNSLRHRNIWSCTTNIYWYTPTVFRYCLLFNRWNIGLRILCCCEEPRLYTDYHASLSSEYPVKYSTGKTSFFTRIEYQKKAVLNKDKIIIKAKKQ